MTPPANDPLLIAGKFLILPLQAIMAAAGGSMAVLAVAAPFFANYFDSELQAKIGPAFVAMPVGAVAGLLLLLSAACALAFLFFGKLRKIIDTVAAGDPFVPRNADRLNAMAWFLTGLYAMRFIIPVLEGAILEWRIQFTEPRAGVGFELNVTQILLVLVLFILARVFRHGAAMREDLEGTV